MSAAIVFFSHVFDPTAVAHLKRIQKESAEFGTFFIYADAKGQTPPDTGVPIETFDFDELRRIYPRILGKSLIPGNCHLTLLHFFKRHPEFHYYWVVEYDVTFTGDWRDFFAAFADKTEDFLACHLRRHDQEPDWYFWNTIQAPGRPLFPSMLVRAFCPVQRISRRALQLVETRVEEGWRGHFEGLIPTVLELAGYSLADFGGDGEYVPAEFRHRFYTSLSWQDGGLLYFGSMRFRPPITWTRSRNTLYHPVKHRSKGAPAKAIGYLVRNLMQAPIEFSRALARMYFSRGASSRVPARAGAPR